MPTLQGTGMTLDAYIEALTSLREEVGGSAMCWLTAYDYPEGAKGPRIERYGDSYTPKNVVLLS